MCPLFCKINYSEAFWCWSEPKGEPSIHIQLTIPYHLMAELLKDNIEAEGRRFSSTEEVSGPSRGTQRTILNFLSWLHCYSLFAAIICSKYLEKSREMWIYQATIIGEAKQCGGNGWHLYDARSLLSANLQISQRLTNPCTPQPSWPTMYSLLRICLASLIGTTGKASPRMNGGEASLSFTLLGCDMNLSVSFSLFDTISNPTAVSWPLMILPPFPVHHPNQNIVSLLTVPTKHTWVSIQSHHLHTVHMTYIYIIVSLFPSQSLDIAHCTHAPFYSLAHIMVIFLLRSPAL